MRELFNKMYIRISGLLFVLLFSVTVTGCGTMLTKQGEAVQITNNYEDIMECKYFGRIIATSSLVGYGFKNRGVNSAINELKNKAAQLGANMIVIQNVTKGDIYTEMTGNAYWCDNK